MESEAPNDDKTPIKQSYATGNNIEFRADDEESESKQMDLFGEEDINKQ